jgi:hypothetical protein
VLSGGELTTLYKTLGVKPDASKREIVSAFRSLALRYHPDHCREANAKDMFIAVRAAYEILVDDQKRAEYDRLLAYASRRETRVGSAPPPAAETSYERWHATARWNAEREAALSYTEFVSTALVSALKFGGVVVVALGQGALLGALGAVLRFLSVLAILVPVVAVILTYATHPALLVLTVPLALGWWVWLVRSRIADGWTPKSAALFVGGLAAFCGLCVALFGVLADINAAKRADVKASFEFTIADLRTHFPEYVRTFPAADVENEPAALGKMVIVDMDARDFHWTFERALPQDMRPRTNAEVDYVVQVRNARKLVGRYSRGGSAYQWQCDYQLVDFRAGRTVFSGSIQGTPPPQSKRYGGDASGSFPLEGLVARWVAKSRAGGTGGPHADPSSAVR